MARKPKPTALKLLEGNPGKRPISKNEPKPEPVAPMPPDHLDELARIEWARASKELEALGLLTRVDMAMFAAYCQAYSRWVQAETFIAFGGMTDTTSNGNVIQSPYVGIANKALEMVFKFGSEFGLSPVSRARLALRDKGEQKSKWAL